jgi:hypothetical protein
MVNRQQFCPQRYVLISRAAQARLLGEELNKEVSSDFF